MKFGILDDAYDPDVEREQLAPEDEVICYGATREEGLPDSVAELDGVLLWHRLTLTAHTSDRLDNCKVIVRAGVGYDSVDCLAAGQKGIPVINVPDYGTNDVADHCMSLLLASVRSLPRYHQALSDDLVANWRPEVGGSIRRLSGACLGIVGLGRIGTAVAMRAKAFGVQVSFFDPYVPDGYDKSLQCERLASIEQLFSESDLVSIHAPLTDETRSLVDAKLLKAAKPGLILVNTARGGIVSLDAVYQALRIGHLKAFAADVLECEPPTVDYPLIRAVQAHEEWCQGRVLLTPHAAFYAEESRRELREKAALQLRRAATGQPTRNCVNREFLVNPRAVLV